MFYHAYVRNIQRVDRLLNLRHRIEVKYVTKHELLKYAVSKGIIDLSALETQVEDMERKRYLEMHRFKVWKDSKGYWITHYN